MVRRSKGALKKRGKIRLRVQHAQEESIELGKMRKKTAQFIEEQKVAVSTEGSRKNKRGNRRGMSEKSRANLRPRPFPKGVSGNPGGKPGCDVAAVIARRIMEENSNEIYSGFASQLEKGNAYAFSVLADRAYGKVKDKQQIEHVGADGKPLSITVRFVKSKPSDSA